MIMNKNMIMYYDNFCCIFLKKIINLGSLVKTHKKVRTIQKNQYISAFY